jgi:hypothetical protein
MYQKFTVGIALAASLLTTSAGAQTSPNVANTSQKGSVLVFPKIDLHEGTNTLVRIHNDGNSNVWVKCFWMNGTKFNRDFSFLITRKQPVWIDAGSGRGTKSVPEFPAGELGWYKPGDPFAGELKCWVTNAEGTDQLRYNHLAGTATVYGDSGAYEYNSWNFKALTGGPLSVVGTGGLINHNGVEYDFCPQYLHDSFIPATAVEGWGATDLSVASCNQDFRQDFDFEFTKLQFTVWNEQEVGFTGAYQCIDSWFETFLERVEHNGRLFSFANLKTPVARYQVEGVASTQCVGSKSVGLVGIQSSQFGSDLVGSNLNSAGVKPGFIKWDPAGIPPERR